MTLIHGGQLHKVAEQYQIPLAHWLDLSTGIAPISYPIPDIPLSAWQQLPQKDPELISIAQQYYQCSNLVVTNGSQAIIKALPELYRKTNSLQKLTATDVYLPARGYKEHAFAWKNADYNIHFYKESLPAIESLTHNSVVVIINPNNPTGKFFERNVIAKYHEKLKELKGLLVVDEAFIDVMPTEQSCCNMVADNHLIVLRSFGKFFGLAGIRIGFLIAGDYWCHEFSELLGPWQVNGPAQIVAKHALSDSEWHNQQCHQLHTLRVQQESLLAQVFNDKLIKAINSCDLFITLSFHQQESSEKLYHLLCQQGIYCRLADEKDTLRFGIANQESFERLGNACVQSCNQLILSEQ